MVAAPAEAGRGREGVLDFLLALVNKGSAFPNLRLEQTKHPTKKEQENNLKVEPLLDSQTSVHHVLFTAPSGTVTLLVSFLKISFWLCPFTSDFPFLVCPCHSVFISGYICLLNETSTRNFWKKLLHLFQNKSNKLTVILQLRLEQQTGLTLNFSFFSFSFFAQGMAWISFIFLNFKYIYENIY